jgi:hypothetical protein
MTPEEQQQLPAAALNNGRQCVGRQSRWRCYGNSGGEKSSSHHKMIRMSGARGKEGASGDQQHRARGDRSHSSVACARAYSDRGEGSRWVWADDAWAKAYFNFESIFQYFKSVETLTFN